MILSIQKNTFLKKYYFSKTPLTRSMIAFTIFSSAMLLFRFAYTQQPMFFFLAWNLFLGYLPYYVSQQMITRPSVMKNPLVFAVCFLAWLLLIPNSFYIITDLFHLRTRDPIPLWFDLSLIFSFSWVGLLLGILSLRQVEAIVHRKWKLRSREIFLLPVMFLISMGIYIGRFLRYNSWDVITDPLGLAGDLVYLFIHPLRSRFDWSMIICFAVLFTLLYITTNHIGRSTHAIKKEMH